MWQSIPFPFGQQEAISLTMQIQYDTSNLEAPRKKEVPHIQ